MDLIIILAIVYFIQNAVIESKYAALGKTSPRWQAKLARLAATNKPAVKPRYGSRAWAADLWADTLEAQTAKRREKTAAKKTVVTEEALAVAAPSPQPAEVVPQPLAPAPAPTHDGPTAQIIPMFPAKKEVPTMSEITGLQSAIAYAEAVSAAHTQHSTGGGEAYIGSLQSFEVSGAAIDAVALAQEASSDAAAAWKHAAAELAKQNIVKEAYDAVPDAGSKAFVQGE